MKPMYLYPWLFVLSFMLGGCVFFQTTAEVKPFPEQVKDLKILIGAAADEITTGIDQGFYTKDEGRPVVENLRAGFENIKVAETFFKDGQFNDANAKLKLADAALNGARAWLRTKSRQQEGK